MGLIKVSVSYRLIADSLGFPRNWEIIKIEPEEDDIGSMIIRSIDFSIPGEIRRAEIIVRKQPDRIFEVNIKESSNDEGIEKLKFDQNGKIE